MVCKVIGVSCKQDLINACEDEELQYYLECVKVFTRMDTISIFELVLKVDEEYRSKYNKIKKEVEIYTFLCNEMETICEEGNFQKNLCNPAKETLQDSNLRFNTFSQYVEMSELYEFDVPKMFAALGYNVRIWKSKETFYGIVISHNTMKSYNQIEHELKLDGGTFETMQPVAAKYIQRPF